MADLSRVSCSGGTEQTRWSYFHVLPLFPLSHLGGRLPNWVLTEGLGFRPQELRVLENLGLLLEPQPRPTTASIRTFYLLSPLRLRCCHSPLALLSVRTAFRRVHVCCGDRVATNSG